MTEGRPNPDLSVLVAVGARRDRVAGCLDSLLDQDLRERMEILLLDVAPEAGPLPPQAGHPAVRVLPFPGVTFGPVRARGVEEARAPVVACIEEHARALPGWAEALLEAHEGPWAGVGPAVVNGNPGVGRSEAAALLAYGLFYGPEEAGRADSTGAADGGPRGCEMEVLPGHNSSFERRVLLSYGEHLVQLLTNENLLFQRLVEDGQRLYLEPRARVAHLNTVGLGITARGLYLYFRTFGRLRAREFGWSRWRRAGYVVFAPLVPLYFLLRMDRILARRRSPWRSLLWRQAPFLLACQAVGALGQAVGLVLGPGSAERDFSHYEMTAERPLEGGPP